MSKKVRTQKKCSKCKVLKPLSEFHKWSKGKYGVKPDCKNCRRDSHREKHLEKQKLYFDKGIDFNGYKKCSRCKKIKSKSEFGLNLSKKDNLKYICSECDNARVRHYFRMKRPYYDKILEEQDFCCAICGTNKPSSNDRIGRFCIDHNHNTNMVRGLLCESCNRGLGLLGDNVSTLLKAVDYLEKSDTKIKYG